MIAPVICALDMQDPAKAVALTIALRPYVGAVKLGLEYFTANGPEGVRAVTALGVPVFLDLKFHDIPNTVAGAVRSAVFSMDCWMLTLHAGGGRAMMTQAREAAEQAAQQAGKKRPLLIAITVLTSFDAAGLSETGVQDAPSEQALRLALLAKDSGLDGIVCSPHEVAAVRAACGKDFLTVIPGIRPASAETHDQKRVLTPEEALHNGADYLVIGRPITEAKNPAAAAEAIAFACQTALQHS